MNFPTRPPPRSSVVTSSSTTSSSPPSPPPTTTPSSPTSPRPPRSSRASFSSSLSTAMLRTTSESWNSSASLRRTAHPCESSTWRRTWPSTPQNPMTSPPPTSRLSSTVSSMAPLPDTLSPKTSQTTPTTPSRLSSERTSTTSSSTPPRTSSSSSTPHGADTANPLPQSGTSSVRSTRITLTSSSPSLTPLPTNSKMSRSRDSPPSNSSQLAKLSLFSVSNPALVNRTHLVIYLI